MARKTFYDILRVDRDASTEEIREAFKRLALRFHPDKAMHLDKRSQRMALKRMQAISEAFTTLRDPRARELYDRCLREGLDFAVESWNLYTPDSVKPSDRAGRAADDGSDFTRISKALLDAVLRMPGMEHHAFRDDDVYFDYVINGRFRANRYLIHLKTLPAIGFEDVAGIINYADQLNDVKQGLLSKAYHSYVLFGQRLDDTLRVKAAVERYNARMPNARRGEPVKGLVLINGSDPVPFVPYAEYMYPLYKQLRLSLS